MKIAIANNNNMCTEHFGHCEGFKIYELENEKVINEDFIKNPGHKPGLLPIFLKEKGINIIISGGMGQMAQELFCENNIEVIVGASGENDKLINQYLKGILKSNNRICEKHEHEGNCEQ